MDFASVKKRTLLIAPEKSRVSFKYDETYDNDQSVRRECMIFVSDKDDHLFMSVGETWELALNKLECKIACVDLPEYEGVPETITGTINEEGHTNV